MSILTINSGSSSLKYALYADEGTHLLLSGKAEEIGRPQGTFSLTRTGGLQTINEQHSFSSQTDVLDVLASHLATVGPEAVTAVGHRVVHGGPHLREHCLITSETISTLQSAIHFAPLHIPPALALIQATERRYPGLPQFACFDTDFHRTLPAEAYTYALPQPYRLAGIRRFGFHGLSYESIVRALGHSCPNRLVVAHLGSGSSICAIRGGKSVDTSMGLSPDGGVPMGTRTGDLDPAVVLLVQQGLPGGPPALTTQQTEDLLDHRSGLFALAGDSDMRELTRRATASDGDAALAISIFSRAVAKTIASYVAILDGLDLLVFTGGIGEHSSEIRKEICRSLAFLGLRLSPASGTQTDFISAEDSTIPVRVIPADEDGEIARHVAQMQAAIASDAHS